MKWLLPTSLEIFQELNNEGAMAHHPCFNFLPSKEGLNRAQTIAQTH